MNVMINRIFSFMLLSSLLFAGCKKEETILEKGVVYSGSPLVNFNNYGGYAKTDVELADKWIAFDYEVKLSNTLEAAKVAHTIKIVKDDNPIGEYNTLNGTNLVSVPLNAYKIEKSEIVIAKGQRKAVFRFEINPSKLNLANTYAFGFSILSATGGDIAVNSDDSQTRMLVEFGTLNEYDGVYNMYSSFFHPTNANLVGMNAFPPGYYEDMFLVTAGGNNVDVNFEVNGSLFITQMVINAATPAYTYFTGVNPSIVVNKTTNAVTVIATTTPGYASIPFIQSTAEIAASKYYPTGISSVPFSAGKKTIVAHFSWNAAGGNRVAKDTFVFVRKR